MSPAKRAVKKAIHFGALEEIDSQFCARIANIREGEVKIAKAAPFKRPAQKDSDKARVAKTIRVCPQGIKTLRNPKINKGGAPCLL